MNVPIRLNHHSRRRARAGFTLAATALGSGLMLASVTAASGQDGTSTRQKDADTSQPSADRETRQATMLEDMVERMAGTWQVSLSISPEAVGAWRPYTEQREHLRIDGFSRISPMMGDQMMRQQFFTEDGRMLALGDRGEATERDEDTPREPRVGTAGEKPRTPITDDPTDEAKLSSVVWFDIDPRTREYTTTFIGPGKRQHIRHGIGTVSMAGNQIIFQAQRDFDAERLRPQRNAGPVVVKWESPDRFTVTMYEGEDPAGQAPAAARTPREGSATRTTGGDQEEGTDGVTASSSRTRQPARERLEDNVIYRAVHLRLTGSDEEDTNERIRSILGASG